MEPARGHLSRQEWTKLLLGLSLLLGLAVRIFPAMLVGFPINDGGMFLVMIRELRDNGFLLPSLTDYNFSNIPFAYPPLGFYVAGILGALGVPELKVLTWLPALVNAASIPAFFLAARAILKHMQSAAAATMIYALVPGSYAWPIMGGGLTRSFGVLFMLLALYCVLQMFQQRAWKYAAFSILWCSLAVLSHPEVGLATATACGLFWAFFGRNKAGTIRATLTSVGVLLLTAPWWGGVLAANGSSPFLAVMHSGAYAGNPLKAWLNDLFKLDLWTGIFHILFLAGLAWNLYKRQYLLPLWAILPYFVEPRSAFVYFPQCIMAAQALVEALPALVQRIRRTPPVDGGGADLASRREFQLGVIGLALLWFLQGGLYAFVLANTSLRPPEPLEAMSWVRAHTRQDSRFLILTGKLGIMSDPIQEWFPALAERESITTLQGQEWILGEEFFPRLEDLAALQECRHVECMEAWSSRTGLRYTHVLLEENKVMEPVIQSMTGDASYGPIYENGKYTVFEKVGQ